MKKKASKKPTRQAPAPLLTSSPTQVPTIRDTGEVGGIPDPEALFHEAEQEQDNRALRQYVDAIRVLRKKSFSYREIAEWLSQRGVEADYNAVYRIYLKSLPDYDAAMEAEREAEEDREEAMRNA